MKAIRELQAQGYIFQVIDGQLEYEYTGDAPDPAIVRPLLAEVRQLLAEALTFVSVMTATVGAARPVLYSAKANEETWWERVFAQRGVVDPVFGDAVIAGAVEQPISSDLLPGLGEDPDSHSLGGVPESIPPTWDGAIVDVRQLPAFRAEHGLRTVGGAWLTGEPWPTLFVEADHA